jgi:beta-lactamase regulating signal transducer with metallopeptidase domain/thiol-disulfide isomerase/thioredoxin/protocatechuate 3,4-dioxygenase beta subunit
VTSILHDSYVGDRALEFLLIVALGVTLVSSVAWMVSVRMARHPACRHLVLISALLCCLSMPLQAALLSSCGWTLLSVPILPAEPPQWKPDLARDGFPAVARPKGLESTDAGGEPARLPRPEPGPQAAAKPMLAPKPPALTEQPAFTTPSIVPSVGRAVSFREIATLILFIWIWGSLILGLRLAWGCWLVRGLSRSARPLDEASIQELRDDICGVYGIRYFPQVLASRHTSTPVAVGVLRPIVILPERLIGEIGRDELWDVLLHEVAHVNRRDTLCVLAQELTRAIYWPIVPVHALIRALGRAREELCDNYVLQHRDALCYGETLLHLAELSLRSRPLTAAVGILHWRGVLEQRIAGLLEEGRSTMTRNSRALVCLVGLVVLAGGALASSTRFVTGHEADRVSPAVAQQPKEADPNAPAEAKPAAKQQRTMLVRVLGPDGQAMAGVPVHRGVWTGNSAKRGDYVTDDRGEVQMELPEDLRIVRLWARARHHVPLFAHWEEEDIPEKTLPAEFTFHLSKGTVIGGVVRNSAGQPIKGVAVDVMLQSGGRVEERTSPDVWLSEGETPITDAAGRWTLDNIPPSLDLDLRLKHSHPDYVSDREWGELQKAQGIDLKALRSRKAVMIMEGGLIATGTVTDPDGKPVAGTVVVRGDDPYREVGSQEVRTDEHGRYQFPPLPTGKLTITVMAPGWMPSLKKVEIRQGMAPFDFRLERGKDLRIRFVDGTGKPVPDVYVMIDGWRGGKSLYNHRHPNVIYTQIPTQADASGVYRWTWAPGDAVSYVFEKRGFARLETPLTARDTEQTITLARILRITGKVTEAATGQPVREFVAMPVAERDPGLLSVWRKDAKVCTDGTYEIEGDRTDVSYRVRIEADGYRSAMSDRAAGATFNFRLEPAPPLAGRVVDPSGRPVKAAEVYVATPSVMLNGGPNGPDRWPDQKVLTDDQGRFAFPAQFERTTLVAANDSGYAEVTLEPGRQPGDLVLKNWAHVQGRVVQAGKPVSGIGVGFHPIRLLNGVSPHIQDDQEVTTDRDGRFDFRRVPSVKASVRAHLSVWRDSALSSSQNVPLDLKPGDHIFLELGGKGTTVRGRVVLSGEAASKIDLHKSLNWLLHRTPGIEPPAEVRALGLAAKNGWNHAWTASQEGLALIESLHTYFVVLDKDGRFAVQGVPAGNYDLALRLYEPPGGGCLVSPVGARIVRFQVSEVAARGPSLDLGDIPIKVSLGPRPGAVVPDFAFAELSGISRTLSALHGRYVLLDFWATWCAPCVASLPALARAHDSLGDKNRLSVLGVNLDDDPEQARAFVRHHKLTWPQAFLGRSDDKDDILSRYAISSVPTYLLISPDGKLVERSEDLQVITEAISRVLK